MMQKKRLYMSRQTVVLIFIATLTGHLREVAIIYASVLLHEMAHLFVCKKKNIPTEYMAIYPYGMELRLKELTAPKEQISISFAGPLVNFLLFALGLLSMQFGIKSRYMSFFVSANLVLCVFNLIPCVPLDGSEIIRSLISSKKGIIFSYTAINRISRGISFFILICACLLAIYGENISLLIVLVIIKQGMKAKRDEQLLAAKKVINGEIKSKINSKIFYSKQGQSAASFIKYISFDYTIIVLRQSHPPLTQDRLISAVKQKPAISVDKIKT